MHAFVIAQVQEGGALQLDVTHLYKLLTYNCYTASIESLPPKSSLRHGIVRRRTYRRRNEGRDSGWWSWLAAR